MGGPKGRSQRASEPAGRSGSGGPEPEAYLKRSDREEPASAGGEISRAAMVSQGRGRPRSCARGAENGAEPGGNDDDHAAGSASQWISRGQSGRTTAPSNRPLTHSRGHRHVRVGRPGDGRIGLRLPCERRRGERHAAAAVVEPDLSISCEAPSMASEVGGSKMGRLGRMKLYGPA